MRLPADPVRQLLTAYQEADTQAALQFQALRFSRSPRCPCQCGASARFRRFFFRLA